MTTQKKARIGNRPNPKTIARKASCVALECLKQGGSVKQAKDEFVKVAGYGISCRNRADMIRVLNFYRSQK